MKKKDNVAKEMVNPMTGLKRDGKSIEMKPLIKPTRICPVCSQSIEENFCPSCGEKAIIPNFCPICQIDCYTQFCGICGTVVFLENMDANKYLYLSSSRTERQLTKMIALIKNSSADQIFVFLELVLKVLNEIREEINSLSELYVKAVNKFSSVDKSIYSFEEVLETLQAEFSNKINEHQNNNYILFGHLRNSLNSLTKQSDEIKTDFITGFDNLDHEVREIERDVSAIKEHFQID